MKRRSNRKRPVSRKPGETSQKKIEANRKMLSSPPGRRQRKGKKMSSFNAMTHGLLAKEVVITTGEGQEDEAEFQSLLAGLRDYYQPVGIVEDLRVQELAASDWRTARALRCERGVVTIASTLTKDNPELSFDEILSNGLKSSAGARHELLGSSRGLNFLLRSIEEVKEEVASTGYVSRESLRWLAPNDIWNGRAGKQAVLEALENEIAEPTTLKAQVEEDEFHQKNARRDPPQSRRRRRWIGFIGTRPATGATAIKWRRGSKNCKRGERKRDRQNWNCAVMLKERTTRSFANEAKCL